MEGGGVMTYGVESCAKGLLLSLAQAAIRFFQTRPKILLIAVLTHVRDHLGDLLKVLNGLLWLKLVLFSSGGGYSF